MYAQFVGDTPGVAPLIDVNDGTYDRVQIGNLDAAANSPAQYGMRVTDPSGIVIFDSLGLSKVMSVLAQIGGGTINYPGTGDGVMTPTEVGFTLSRTLAVLIIGTGTQSLFGNGTNNAHVGVLGVGSSAAQTFSFGVSGSFTAEAPTTGVYVVELAAGSYTAAWFGSSSWGGGYGTPINFNANFRAWALTVFQLGS